MKRKKNQMVLSVSKKVIPEWKKLKLKPKEIMFLSLYINNGFNGRQAYLDSIAREGTTIEAATTQANQTLRKPNVSAAFTAWKELYIEVTKEMLEPAILNQLKKRAFYDILTFTDSDGNFKQLNEIEDEWRCCIDGVERKYYGKDADVCVVVSKLADRDKAMDKLEKYIDMIKEKGNNFNVNVDGDLKIEILNILQGNR